MFIIKLLFIRNIVFASQSMNSILTSLYRGPVWCCSWYVHPATFIVNCELWSVDVCEAFSLCVYACACLSANCVGVHRHAFELGCESECVSVCSFKWQYVIMKTLRISYGYARCTFHICTLRLTFCFHLLCLLVSSLCFFRTLCAHCR